MNTCSQCGVEIVKPAHGLTPGYGVDQEHNIVCYVCCAIADRADMIEQGKAVLHLTRQDGKPSPGAVHIPKGYQVTNWPGSLSFPAVVNTGHHNWGLRRYDAWFAGPDGHIWHGVTIGDDTELCHVKRRKALADDWPAWAKSA